MVCAKGFYVVCGVCDVCGVWDRARGRESIRGGISQPVNKCFALARRPPRNVRYLANFQGDLRFCGVSFLLSRMFCFSCSTCPLQYIPVDIDKYFIQTAYDTRIIPSTAGFCWYIVYWSYLHTCRPVLCVHVLEKPGPMLVERVALR